MSPVSTPQHHAALASAPRRAVLDMLRAAAEPLDTRAVADALGLHVTTARFHLDHLVRAGLATRSTPREGQRGRPRVLFTAGARPTDAGPAAQLIDALADALDDRTGAADAVAAGRRWADTFAPLDRSDPVTGLTAVFDRLGFAPQRDAASLRLHDCPFRDSARRTPHIVCAVHKGLLEGLFASSGLDDEVRLVPFIESDLCLVTVGRPDEDAAGRVR